MGMETLLHVHDRRRRSDGAHRSGGDAEARRDSDAVASMAHMHLLDPESGKVL